MTRGRVPVAELVVFTVLRFLASAFEELQRLLYLRVKVWCARV
jgi:hypothetical protein